MSPYGAMNGSPMVNADPKGDFAVAAIAIGAGIGLLTNGISNLRNDRPFFENFGQAATFGGISGALSFGIGQAFGAVGSLANEFGRATAHGLAGGALSHIQGGSFGSGFLSGLFSSGLSSGIDALGGGTVAQILGGGLSGGFSSALGGGDFWSGVGQGVAVGGLNHAVHSLFNNNKGGPPWEYQGKKYHSESDLYMAIFIDEAMQQFGIKDAMAIAGVIAGQPILKKRFVTPGSSSGTSPLSKYLSPRMGKSPIRLPTLVANTGRVGIAWTTSIGKFTSRAIPFVGWGILAYDSGKILYNTQVKFNRITQ